MSPARGYCSWHRGQIPGENMVNHHHWGTHTQGRGSRREQAMESPQGAQRFEAFTPSVEKYRILVLQSDLYNCFFLALSVPVLIHRSLCISPDHKWVYKRRSSNILLFSWVIWIAVYSDWNIQMIVQDFGMRIFWVHTEERIRTAHAKV